MLLHYIFSFFLFSIRTLLQEIVPLRNFKTLLHLHLHDSKVFELEM